jgi:hypothetical protein
MYANLVFGFVVSFKQVWKIKPSKYDELDEYLETKKLSFVSLDANRVIVFDDKTEYFVSNEEYTVIRALERPQNSALYALAKKLKKSKKLGWLLFAQD